MKTLMTIPATIRKYVKSVDVYGNELRDKNTYFDTSVKCWIHQQAAGLDAEDTMDREQSISKYIIYFYGNPDVDPEDVIIVGDFDGSGDSDLIYHEVYGEPARFYNRQGKVNHLQVLTRVIEG